MITLITGQPGDGKSLYAISAVKAQSEKENRPVFYSGIPELKLPWIELENAEKWFECPKGAIIVIDEAQRIFRPRGTGAAVPKHVAELETHRHSGFDIFIITQQPMLCDSNVRRLVGRHFHCKRKFGAPASTVHEWSQVKERPDQTRDDSIRHEFLFPKSVYSLYKSAEVHTHKLRIPMRVYAMLLLPLLFAACVYGTVMWVKGRTGQDASKAIVGGAGSVAGSPGQVVSGQIQRAGMVRPGSPESVEAYMDAYKPRVEGLPHTAARYDQASNPVNVPFPAACVTNGKRCQCYTDQATRLSIPQEICLQIVERGFFIEFAVHRTMESTQGERAVVVPAQGSDLDARSEPSRVLSVGQRYEGMKWDSDVQAERAAVARPVDAPPPRARVWSPP